MKRNWRYFVGASVLGGFFLWNAGAPPFAIATGILLGGLMTLRATRSA
jgi:hypothetical protein